MSDLPLASGKKFDIFGPQGEHAVVYRTCTGSYRLVKDGISYHSRFGNAVEIREDIEHFELTGYLPEGKMF